MRFEEPIQAALFHGHSSWWPPGARGTDGASLIRFACGFCDRLRITIPGQCAGAQIKAQLPLNALHRGEGACPEIDPAPIEFMALDPEALQIFCEQTATGWISTRCWLTLYS